MKEDLETELEQVKKELAWFRDYGYYVANVYRNIDAEACAYADGDEEYEESFNN
jgi:DNA-binding IclR family transcriptional regulator